MVHEAKASSRSHLELMPVMSIYKMTSGTACLHEVCLKHTLRGNWRSEGHWLMFLLVAYHLQETLSEACLAYVHG